jgi:uncharacterized protein (TIGR04255 family)
VRDVEDRVTEVVAQKLTAGANAGDPATLIIDVDVFKEEALPVSAADLRPQLEVLRNFKNRAFFALLTEEAVNLYA